MPHLIVDRPRMSDLLRAGRDAGPSFLWESLNAIFYILGGLVFVGGSVLFFPRYEALADLGAWAFFGGSLFYLVVTGHDLAEAVRYRRHAARDHKPLPHEIVAGLFYLVGTLLFVIGSVLFLSAIDRVTAGAWCFIAGSLLFVAAAAVNVLQIVVAPTMVLLQLMNLTAVSFVAGSVLFTVASVPYLWSFSDPADGERVYAFLAWQYLFGSVLFLLGGIFNYRRAWIVVAAARDTSPHGVAARRSGAAGAAVGRAVPPPGTDARGSRSGVDGGRPTGLRGGEGGDPPRGDAAARERGTGTEAAAREGGRLS